MEVIRTLKNIEPGDEVTDHQRSTLDQWAGWGATPRIFDESDAAFAAQRDELKDLLTTEEYAAARRTTLTAFYTDPQITKAMWEVLETAGYAGGTVLEPGSGKGDFIRTAPEGTRSVGIEIDPTTARIASLLNPDAQIRNESFVDTDFPDDTFTATIGNVPFSQVQPYDPIHNPGKLSLHNYMLAKSIDLTAPGGYVAAITSTYTADSKETNSSYTARQALTDRADFITGVRLPSGKNGAFADSSGTEVATDILIFRVREDGQEPTELTEQFLDTETITLDDGSAFTINSFFANNRRNMLGTPTAQSGRFGPTLGIEADPSMNLGDTIAEVLGSDVYQAGSEGYGLRVEQPATSAVDTAGLIQSATEANETAIGTLRYTRTADGLHFEQLNHFGETVIRHGEEHTVPSWQAVTPAKKYAEQWAQIIDLRDTTTALITACRDESTDEIHALRIVLNAQYDSYVAQHGPLNLHELQKPRAKTDKQINDTYASLENVWRRDNAINDRPYEGTLPTDVADALYEQASEQTAQPKVVHRHLKGALSRDPFLSAVLALEEYNQDTKQAKKGALFTTNPIRTVHEPDHAESVRDAVGILHHSDKELTVDNIVALVDNVSAADVEAQLTNEKLAYRNPLNPEQWVPATQYLSGPVRTKLHAAADAATHDARFIPNRDALEEVLPPKITEGIEMNLGAPWIPADIYVDFIAETLNIPDNRRSQITVTNAVDQWFVDIPQTWTNKDEADVKWGVAAANASGEYNFRTSDRRMTHLSHHGVAHRGRSSVVYSSADVVKDAFNGTPPKLNYSLEARRVLGIPDPENKTEMYPQATRFAGRKVGEVRERFSEWTKEDPERYTRLIDAYNEKFNNVIAPVYDGSQREMPGLSEKFTPYYYQRNAVERMVNEPGTLLNHTVGAGKTGTMVMGAIELKRTGRATKPALIAPNHLVSQIAREAKQWYPGAEVLNGDAAHDGPEARQMFAAQIATRNWDLIVIPESVYKLMPLDAEYQRDYMQTSIDAMREDLNKLQVAESSGKGHIQSVKDLEKRIEQREEKLKETIDKIGTDQGVTFDQTGIDYVIVDEAHGYKNLERYSPARELSHPGSQKALDMDMKLNYLRSQKPEGAPVVTFATGTPITNSISEMWVMQHYLRPDLLEEADVSGVNAWANTFTTRETGVDFTSGGRITEKVRISRYVNTPELARMSTPFMDYVTRAQIPATLPTLNGGKNTVVEFDPGIEVKDFNRDLLWREEHLNEEGMTSQIDNPLKLINDGKAATLDPRMAGLDYDPEVGRVKALSDTVEQIWRDNRDNTYTDQHGETSPNRGGLQIIFCDRGVPNNDPERFSLYDAIRDELVDRGMERQRIAFVHEWDKDRLGLYDACNNGEIDVVIGNTTKLSTGANIQSRAVGLHHVDVPWRPADLDQREGRIIRQGNQNENISIFNYIAAGTSDGFSWNTVQRKQAFIEQIYTANLAQRDMEPLESNDEAFAHNKAIATGNPDFIRAMQLAREIEGLESKKTEHEANKASREFELNHAKNELPRNAKKQHLLGQLVEDAQAWLDKDAGRRTWTFNGKVFSERKEATAAMVTTLGDVARSRTTEPVEIGSIGGVPIRARYSYTNSALEISSPAGVQANGIPENLIRENFVRTDDEQKKLPQTRAGFLTRMESSVKHVLEQHQRSIDDGVRLQATIERLETSPETGDFPEQPALNDLIKEKEAVDKRLTAFNESAAEKQAQQDHLTRLADKDRMQGFSLALNPTKHMVEEGMEQHPHSRPIMAMASHGHSENTDGWISTDSDADFLDAAYGEVTDATPAALLDDSLIEDFEDIPHSDAAGDESKTNDDTWNTDLQQWQGNEDGYSME